MFNNNNNNNNGSTYQHIAIFRRETMIKTKKCLKHTMYTQ